MLTPGQDHDLACAGPLLENTHPGAVIADKAYDADALIDKLTEQGATPVIPPKANRKDPRECDFVLYCERNLIEPSPARRIDQTSNAITPDNALPANKTNQSSESKPKIRLCSKTWVILKYSTM
jgi:transposase